MGHLKSLPWGDQNSVGFSVADSTGSEGTFVPLRTNEGEQKAN